MGPTALNLEVFFGGDKEAAVENLVIQTMKSNSVESSKKNHLLGLAAIASPCDGHVGPFIIAMAFLRDALTSPTGGESEVDSKIQAYAKSQNVIDIHWSDFVSIEFAKHKIETELMITCGNLHFIAHDMIIGAYALAAIEKFQSPLPRKLVDGICKTIRGFSNAPPGIFFGYEASEIREMETHLGIDTIIGPKDLVQQMKSFLERVQVSYLGYGFRAQEYHIITHTHALVWYHQNQYHEVYRTALKPWILRMRLLEKILNPTEPILRRALHDPIQIGSQDFWERMREGPGDLHLFKASHALIEFLQLGLLNQMEVDAIVEKKFGYLFSIHENEFVGIKPD